MMNARKTVAAAMTFVALIAPLSASAEPHGGGWRHGRHERFEHRGHYDGGWFPWLLFGTIAAVAIANSSPRVEPVVVEPAVIPPAPAPVIVAPPSIPPAMAPAAPPPQAMWYYCAAAGKYYPYVGTCPTGWTPVPAVPPGQ